MFVCFTFKTTLRRKVICIKSIGGSLGSRFNYTHRHFLPEVIIYNKAFFYKFKYASPYSIKIGKKEHLNIFFENF